MKKIIIISIVLLTVNFTFAQNLKTKLSGNSQKTWQLVFFENNELFDDGKVNINNEQDFINTYHSLYQLLPYEITFKSNGNYFAVFFKDGVKKIEEGNFFIEKDRISFKYSEEEDAYYFENIKIEGNKFSASHCPMGMSEGFKVLIYKLK